MQRTIDSTLVPMFEEKFAKLARKAGKLGLPAPSYKIVKEEFVEDTRYESYGIKLPETPMRQMTTIEISDVDIIIAENWKVVGEIKGEAFEGVKSASGKTFNEALYIEFEPLPKECYEKNPMLCEHCNTNRYRKYTYILKNMDDGRYMQVGSSCVEDFVHVKNLDSVLKWLEDLSAFLVVMSAERPIGEQHVYAWLHVASLMKYAVYIVDTYGYKKHKADDKKFVSSAKAMYTMLTKDETKVEFVASVENKAVEVVNYYKHLLDLMMEQTIISSTRLNTVKSICSDFISTEYNSLDALCFAVYEYNRHLESEQIDREVEERRKRRKETERKEREERERKHNEYEQLKANSVFVGEVGGKLNTDAIFTHVILKVGDYGRYKICSFNVDGNIVKCFVNEKNKAYNVMNESIVDSKVHISGTIKSHDVYNGVKSTMFKNIVVTVA